MITGIQNTSHNKNIQFRSKEQELFRQISGSLKLPLLFVKSQENLSSTRFIQDTVTNWVPKAIFARGLADFGDMSFLEFIESGIFYFAPPILGEFIARQKLFINFTPKALRQQINEQIPKKTTELIKNIDNVAAKRALPIKAAIVLSCACIPAAEYALSFAKNLFTLKIFNKSDFNNIANLNKNHVECKEQQEKVKKNAKKHITNAGIFSAAALGVSIILATLGHKFKPLQSLSKLILQPGEILAKGFKKIGFKSPKLKEFLGTYINADFDSSNGKLALSKGQLAITAVSGLFGYSAAAADRGKLDKLEVWTRVPIVVLYTIFGGAVFDYAFKHILLNNKKYPDLIRKNSDGTIASIPALKELPEISENLARINKTNTQKEFNKLLKQKAIITAVPYAFSLIVMGFLLAGITRFWTQYRYSHGLGHNYSNKKEKNQKNILNNSQENKSPSFKKFSHIN